MSEAERAGVEAVLRALYRRGARSVADLAGDSGVSRITVGKVLAELSEIGVVDTVPERRSTGGRPARLKRIRPGLGYVLGIDVGPGSVRVRLDALEGPQPVVGRPTGSPAGPAAAVGVATAADLGVRTDAATAVSTRLAILDRVVDAALTDAGVGMHEVWAVCAATPGIVDADGRITASSVVQGGWRGDVLRRHLTRRVDPICAVSVENDGNAAAVAEAELGSVHPAGDELITVHIGRRLGIGVVRGGRLYRGARGRVGEVGNLKDSAWRAVDDWLDRHARTNPQVFSAADPIRAPADEDAAYLVAEFAELLARPVAELAFTYDPDLVTITGPASFAGEALLTPLTAQLRSLWEGVDPVEVRLSRLGSHGVLLGAVVLAQQAAELRLLQRVTGEPR